MNWLTIEQVRTTAQESPQAALACSVEHWRQLSTATYEELSNAYFMNGVALDVMFCALCQRYWAGRADCSPECPLVRAGQGCQAEKAPYLNALRIYGRIRLQ